MAAAAAAEASPSESAISDQAVAKAPAADFCFVLFCLAYRVGYDDDE
jgi:hypothetical protein